MEEYRQKFASPAAPAKPARPDQSQAFMPLKVLEAYGLVDMRVGGGTMSQQTTVQQEFQAYTNTEFGPQDIIKFWTVSHYQYFSVPANVIPRKIQGHIRPFSVSQWTTFRSRHPPCLVSACFRQVPRQTLRDEIVSSPSSWRCCRCSSFRSSRIA